MSVEMAIFFRPLHAPLVFFLDSPHDDKCDDPMISEWPAVEQGSSHFVCEFVEFCTF